MADKKKRFVKVYSQSGGLNAPGTYVLVDTETGVNYLYASGGYGGGLTPLLNADGKPLITSVPKTDN